MHKINPKHITQLINKTSGTRNPEGKFLFTVSELVKDQKIKVTQV